MEISDILVPERTICDVSSNSKKAALEILASLIASADSSLSQTDVFMGLMDREKLGSTGLGKGIGLPHGRMKGAKSPLGDFVRLQQPIDYDAIDGAPQPGMKRNVLVGLEEKWVQEQLAKLAVAGPWLTVL